MPERTIVMARKRKVTSEVIESMKMLHDQGVKVAMIADVLSFSKWTVYQAKKADWNLDKYITTRNAHFDAQKKDVRDTSILLSSSTSLNGESSVIPTDGLSNLSTLASNGFTDTVNKLTSIAGGIVEINRTLGQLVSIFQHIDDELTGESTTI
jgi:hypothetical protein|tara:strand:- start:135 stop:593 length:459 start_codon:yes stop_codon:yes gene_type:complete